MSETTTFPNEGMFKYQDYTFSPDAINAFNLFVLTQQGITHKMGNECAARLTAWSKSDEGKNATEEDKVAKLKEFRDEMAAKILGAEKLGVRAASGAARVTGAEAQRRSIALDLVKVELDKQSKRTGTKVSVPTGENTITIGTKVYTREALIEASLKKWADKIDAEVARRNAFKSEGEDAGEDLFGDE